MATQTTPTLSTVERLLDEVEEYSARLQKLRHKLSRLRRGSEAYLELLPDVEVALDVLRSKAEHAHEALDDFEDSLSDPS
jgi:chromosome segregation ATPase